MEFRRSFEGPPWDFHRDEGATIVLVAISMVVLIGSNAGGRARDPLVPRRPHAEPCPHHSPSGEDVPGGFGWLSVTPGCTAVIEGGWIDGSTSVDPPAGGNTGCTMEELYDLLTGTITVPVFDQIVGTGENARYHIASFSTFHVTDFKMYTANRYRGHTTIYNNPSCLRLAGGGNQTVCFDGYFIAHGLPLSAGIRVVVELIE